VIILSLLNGSRLYGTNKENSDYDIVSVYTRHRKDYYLSAGDLRSHNTRFELDEGRKILEVTYIDFISFCKFLIKGNPNYIIPMVEWKPLYTTTTGDLIKAMLPVFFDYDNIKSSFEGMIYSLENGLGTNSNPKRYLKSQNAAKFIKEWYQKFMRSEETLFKGKRADIEEIKKFIDILMVTEQSL
jgi:predicted nucleotidyltransferase